MLNRVNRRVNAINPTALVFGTHRLTLEYTPEYRMHCLRYCSNNGGGIKKLYDTVLKVINSNGYTPGERTTVHNNSAEAKNRQ